MSIEQNEEVNSLKKYLYDDTLPEEEMTKRQWRIIEAAVKIFAEKGFEGSRTSEIAKEAEVAEGTIFRYYKTKKDLLIGLLFPLTARFFRPLALRSLEKIVDNKEEKAIEEIILDLLMDRLELIKKNAPLIKTVLIESQYHPELIEPLRKEIFPQILSFLGDFIEKSKEEKKIKEMDTKFIARTLMSLLMGYVILSTAFPDNFAGESDEEEIKKIVDVFLNGIKYKEE